MSARLVSVVLIAGLVLSGCSIFGGDDEREPAPLPQADGSAKISRAWTRGIGEGTDRPIAGLQPAHADGNVLAASVDGWVRSFDLNSGTENWATRTDIRISAGPGVGRSVAVVGGYDGEVIALDLATGAEVWTARVSSEVLAAPAVDNNIAVVRSQDGRVFGFRTSDGFREWVYDQSVPALSLRGTSAPVTGGGFAYLGFDSGKLAALRLADGTVVWEETVAVPQGRTELDRIVDVDGPMMLIASELYAASYQGQLAALTADTGRLLWVKDISSFNGLAAARTEIAVADADDAVWLLERNSGGTLWKQESLLRRKISPPAIHLDTIAVGDFEGYVHWLDEDDGHFVAQARAGKGAIGSQPLAVGPMLVVQTTGGQLTAFKLTR